MLRCLVLSLLACFLGGGCAASSPDHTFEVPTGAYSAAFDAARNVLRDSHFVLDRVDAEEGVITTLPKQSSGLATPWDSQQTSLYQEFEDTAHSQQRRVRVDFVPVDQADASAADPPRTGRVEVVLERMQLVGWQPSSKAILQSGFATDPLAQARGQGARYEVPMSRDDDLAARLAERIRRRIAEAFPAQAPAR